MNKELIKKIQKKVGVTADGIIGSVTLNAIAKSLGVTTNAYPTQAQVRKGTSIFGKAGDTNTHTRLRNLPYPLKYDGKEVESIYLHKLMEEPLRNALTEILKHYGINEIKRLGLDEYNGCYNYRETTNGKSMSIHAWGAAIDMGASKNAYKMKSDTASFAKPEYKAFVDIMEKHGLMSFGRKYGYDWMHFQLPKY